MLIAVLATLAMLIGGVIALTAAFMMTRRARLDVEKRLDLVAEAGPSAPKPASFESSLRAEPNRTDERVRRFFTPGVEQTWGMRAGSTQLILFSLAAMGLIWLVVGRTFHASALITLPACLTAGFLLPRSFLLWQQRKVERRFADVFPDAIDTVARMLRAGLPATLAIGTVGDEGAPPVNTVFATIADQMRIGIPLGEALDASSRKIALADFRFFSVAVALQHATGGNLVNTLDMLSQIMRKRRAVRLKAKAVTSEIRLSAYVLGSLPFVTALVLLILQPGYLTPLIEDPRGQIILSMAGGGLLLSVISMKLMMKSVSRQE